MKPIKPIPIPEPPVPEPIDKTGAYRCPSCNITVVVSSNGSLTFSLPIPSPGGRRVFPVPGHNCEFAKPTNRIDYSKLEKVG